jgi:hypothetical protein
MKKLIYALTIMAFASCTKDDKPEKRAIFYEVAGPSAYQVRFIDENNKTVLLDTVRLGWNKNQWIEVGKYAGIEATKISDTTTYSIDFLRMYIAGKKYESIDSGYKNSMSLWHKVE